MSTLNSSIIFIFDDPDTLKEYTWGMWSIIMTKQASWARGTYQVDIYSSEAYMETLMFAKRLWIMQGNNNDPLQALLSS